MLLEPNVNFPRQLMDIKTCGTILIASWTSEINWFWDFWRKTCLFMSLFSGSSFIVKRIHHSNQSRLLLALCVRAQEDFLDIKKIE